MTGKKQQRNFRVRYKNHLKNISLIGIAIALMNICNNTLASQALKSLNESRG